MSRPSGFDLLLPWLNLIGLSVFLGIGSSWIASKLVVGGDGRTSLGRAVTCWVIQLLAALGVGVIGGGLLLAGAALGLGGALSFVLLVVWGAAFVVAAVVVPKRVYDIGTLRAVIFLFVAGLVNGALTGGVRLAAPSLVPRESRVPSLMDLASLRPGKDSPGAVTADPRPVPAAGVRTVTMLETARLPLILAGKTSGDIEVERGTVLDVVADEGKSLLVDFAGATCRVPKSKVSR